MKLAILFMSLITSLSWGKVIDTKPIKDWLYVKQQDY